MNYLIANYLKHLLIPQTWTIFHTGNPKSCPHASKTKSHP